MKVDNSVKTLKGGAVTEGQARKSEANGSKGPDKASGSEVKLSPLSSQLKALEAGLADVPVMDQAKVEEIKRAIASGHFKVNAEVVADRVIETAKELLSAHKA